jgi:AGZA family xanthine/uracil permease-like MFS transporter
MKRYGWARTGDINAFFGLMLDNLAVMMILVRLITSDDAARQADPENPRFTTEFVLTHMIPGTALGVLLGDLVFTWMAFRLARQTGKSDVTAMPLGLDTPSTFGVAFLVLLDALRHARKDLALEHGDAMLYAWHVSLVVLMMCGVFKMLCAPLGNLVRKLVPRAALLGTLAAIALALIAFMPLQQDIARTPVVGMLALVVILITIVAHRRLPWNFPGALAAVLVGVLIYFGCLAFGETLGIPVPRLNVTPVEFGWLKLPATPEGRETDGWWMMVGLAALQRLPVALPFALATIVGGIDCTESAAAAGDEYDTRTILLTEGIASFVAGMLGGVIQTTPYIGHPAYKAMGGRAAYTLATALFVGLAGVFGWFGFLFRWLPEAAMFPILVFVGLEITAQSFRATPSRHYPALALAILPTLAYLIVIFFKTPGVGVPKDDAAMLLQTLRCLGNGFIVTGLLWAAALVALLDGRLRASAAYFVVAGLCAFFGVIHSPLGDEQIGLPHQILALRATSDSLPFSVVQFQTPIHWTAAYMLTAGLVFALSFVPTPNVSADEITEVEQA